MQKRLISMALVIVMLLSAIALASCSDKNSYTGIANVEGAKTITMWIVSENDISPETEKLVENAFSAITKSKYKVNVDLVFYTEDEYFTKLESKLVQLEDEYKMGEELKELLDDAISEGKKEGKLTEEEIIEKFFQEYPEYEPYRHTYKGAGSSDAPVEQETVINDYGIPEIKYPAAGENQVDIIYISGYDRYISYIDAEWLAPLDEELAGVAAKLTTYVSTPLLQGTKVGDVTYAIPNNNEIGEYTYMLLDKQICDKYYFNYSKVNSIIDCQSLVEDIMIHENKGLTASDAGYVLPIASSFDECLDMLVWYWNIDVETSRVPVIDEEGFEMTDENGRPIKVEMSKYTINRDNKFNLVGCLYGSALNVNRGDITLKFNSLFADENYRNTLLALKKYQFDNCYGEPAEGQKSAISFMKGDYSVKQNWTDPSRGIYKDANGKEYYAVVVRYPQADSSDIYGNMFAVSAFSGNITECMEVITELNTSRELKNILQYGVLGTHYTIESNKDGTTKLVRLNNDYMMNMDVTGNCFMAHPEEGKPSTYWNNVRLQNSEALIDPLLGFDINAILEEKTMSPDAPASLDNTQIADIKAMSEAIWAELEACTSYTEYRNLINGPTGSIAIKPIVDRLKYDAGTMVKFGDKSIDFHRYCSGTARPEGESTIYYASTLYLAWAATQK